MKLGVIGAGRVGVSLGKYFSKVDGVELTGYYSRTLKSAEEGAAFTGSSVFTSLQDILEASDTLLITTPDGEISSVWDCIVKECDIAGMKDQPDRNSYHKIVCHVSGSLSSEVFSENKRYGIAVCSMHPMYAFHQKYESYKQLHHVFFTLEGDRDALAVFTDLLNTCGNSFAVIDSDAKVKYHCAAAMASNQVVALIGKSMDMLMECGFTKQAAYEMLKPLARDNVKNIFDKGVEAALTGPVERNDVDTVKKHLAVLKPDEAKLYSLLSEKLVGISESKYPEADYREMRSVLTSARPADA